MNQPVTASRAANLVRNLLLLLLLSPAVLLAEVRRFGDYEIHYSVFHSSFLLPAIASRHDILRAPDRAVLNIALRRRTGDSSTVAVAASFSGTRGDLIYSEVPVFREIREDEAIYYLNDYRFISGETHYFDLSVTPADGSAPLRLQFNHTLYID